MTVTGSDMKIKLSVAAAAGNTTAGTPAGSLGDQVSTTELVTATIGNLFDDVSASEASAGDIEYRCGFVCNDHATDTAIGVQLAIQSQVPLGGTIDIGVDPAAASPRGQASTQAATIANESTAPAGVTFSAGPITIGDLAALNVRAFWVRRTVSASTAGLSGDGATLRISGEG